MIKVMFEGKEVEADITDYTVLWITAKPHSKQLFELFQFNESLEINNKKYNIIEMVRQDSLVHIKLVEEQDD